jgi:hypothetical protein
MNSSSNRNMGRGRVRTNAPSSFPLESLTAFHLPTAEGEQPYQERQSLKNQSSN